MNSSNQGMYQSIAAKRHQMSGPPFHNATMYFGPNAQRRPSLKPSQGGPQAPNQERKKKKIQIFDPATGKDLMEACTRTRKLLLVDFRDYCVNRFDEDWPPSLLPCSEVRVKSSSCCSLDLIPSEFFLSYIF